MSIRDLYKQIPVNARVFAETVLGAEDPITEEDFTAEDLRYLRSLVDETSAKNDAREAQLLRDRDYYRANPDLRSYELGEGGNLVDITDREREELDRKIKSYEDTRGRTSVNYGDITKTQKYGTEGEFESITKTIKDSFLDPAYRAKTTLGRFTAEQQEDGSVVIKDTYDWNQLDQKVSLQDFLDALPGMIRSPRKAGNAFMRLVKPDTSREVNIKLPDDYREGGSVKLI